VTNGWHPNTPYSNTFRLVLKATVEEEEADVKLSGEMPVVEVFWKP